MGEKITNKYIESESEDKEKMKALDFVKEKSQEIAPELIEIRRKIHENPELGFEEFETAKLVADKLKEIGLDEIETGIGKTGVIGILKGKEGGKTIALRADMDALKIQENSGEEFSSKTENKMHACGHDAHVAACLGTAEILKELKDKQGLDGDVVFIFQPNEEKAVNNRSGSVEMIKHLYKKGIWQKVDSLFAFHVQAGLPLGTVRMRKGLVLAGSQRFDMEVTGPGGHASKLHEAAPITMLSAKTIADIHQEFNPQEPQLEPNEVIVDDTFLETEEPHSYNVIPKKVKGGGTIRIMKEDNYRENKVEVRNKIRQIADNAIKPWKEKGAEYKFQFTPGTRPVVHRDQRLVDEAEEVCHDVIGKDVKFARQAITGGEDLSFYLEKFRGRQIPGVYFFLGAANPGKGIEPSIHHKSEFKFDEDVIPQASAVLAEMTRRELSHKD